MKLLKQTIVFAFALAAVIYFAFSERGPVRVHAKFLGGPPLSMTGAPGEGTCVGCHYTYGEPNTGAGHVRIVGLPAVYTPNQTYNVTVTVADPQARSWGFETTALDALGRSALNANGTSPTVGNLSGTDDLTTTKRTSAVDGKTRIYISHFTNGIQQGQANSASWTFQWTAPNANAGDVTFYASGNAANNQVSPENDYIYTTMAVVKSPNAEKLAGFSAYSASSGSSQVDLTVQGTFDAGAKIVFYGSELTTQSVAGGLSASIPASLLLAPGAYPVAVREASGTVTNTRFFVLSSAVNPQAVTATDAATYTTTVAPGQIATLFGTRLIAGNGVAFAPAIPLPLTMQNSTVYVNGVPAPLYYTSGNAATTAGQFNVQIPFSTPAGTASVVVLRSDGEISRGTVTVQSGYPSLFTVNQQGTGQAVAQNAVDNSLNGDPATGAVPGMKRVKKGDYLIFYGTGLGSQLVNFSTGQPVKVSDGVAAGANPIIATATTPTVTIGGKQATVAFSGLSPAFVALWQLNVQIPLDAPSGAAVDVVINYGGVASRVVTVAVE
jgi:uncharacterized protein (TIGR03437 family)